MLMVFPCPSDGVCCKTKCWYVVLTFILMITIPLRQSIADAFLSLARVFAAQIRAITVFSWEAADCAAPSRARLTPKDLGAPRQIHKT